MLIRGFFLTKSGFKILVTVIARGFLSAEDAEYLCVAAEEAGRFLTSCVCGGCKQAKYSTLLIRR